MARKSKRCVAYVHEGLKEEVKSIRILKLQMARMTLWKHKEKVMTRKMKGASMRIIIEVREIRA